MLIITTNALFTIFGVYLLVRELARENGLTKKKFAAMTRLSKILSKKKLVFKDNELIGFNQKNGGSPGSGEQKNTSNKKREKEVEMTDMHENPMRPRSKSLATAAVFEGAAVHSNPIMMRLANREEKNTATTPSSQEGRSSNATGRKYTKKESKKKRNRLKMIKLASKPKAATIIEMPNIELEPQETGTLASISNPMHKTSDAGTTVETKVVERPTTREVYLDKSTGRRYSIDSGTQQSNWIDEVDVVRPNHEIFLDESSGRRYSIDRDTRR